MKKLCQMIIQNRNLILIVNTSKVPDLTDKFVIKRKGNILKWKNQLRNMILRIDI